MCNNHYIMLVSNRESVDKYSIGSEKAGVELCFVLLLVRANQNCSLKTAVNTISRVFGMMLSRLQLASNPLAPVPSIHFWSEALQFEFALEGFDCHIYQCLTQCHQVIITHTNLILQMSQGGHHLQLCSFLSGCDHQ